MTHMDDVMLYPAPVGIPPSNRFAVTINGMVSFTYLTTGRMDEIDILLHVVTDKI